MRMTTSIEVLFAPAEFAALANRDLSQTVCVVFDIFRATSTIVTALANGAAAIIPVAEIPEALALRLERPEVLLAGERDGLRINADLTGGTDFDLGNSPREFTPRRIHGKTIALSTTNGSRALRACAQAKAVIIGSFLNLGATAGFIQLMAPAHLLLVCSGTANQAAYEDVLGAGAMASLLWDQYSGGDIADSAKIASQIYEQNHPDLLNAAKHCRNGRRLLTMPELRDDIAWCLQRDLFHMIAGLKNGSIVKIDSI
jgi:2-phosphosulfolactate phosphatase